MFCYAQHDKRRAFDPIGKLFHDLRCRHINMPRTPTLGHPEHVEEALQTNKVEMLHFIQHDSLY